MSNSRRFWRGLFFVSLIAALCGGLALPLAEAPAHAAPQRLGTMEIVINEVSWAGTIASPNDEWIELYNPGADQLVSNWRLVSDSGSLDISLPDPTIIPAGGYFLIERRQQATSVPADLITSYPWSLTDAGDTLRLSKEDGSLVDTANADGGIWPAGSSSPNGSMERFRPLADTDIMWTTNDGTVASGATDAAGNPIHGTPRTSNWAYTVVPSTTTTITSDLPEPSAVGQNVTVTVTVTGGFDTPKGTVTISGADTNCPSPITLDSSGTGSCQVSFASIGSKTIAASYSGDATHLASTDTESHTVQNPPTITIQDNPDPSIVNGDVSVIVTLTGATSIPTGTVTISSAGATGCSTAITLDAAGVASCTLKYNSVGAKTITVSYSGDSTYTASNQTASHQVANPTATAKPTSTAKPTPTKVRTATLPPPPPPPLIAINEFVPRPGHDWNLDGVVNTDDEYIELLNHGVIDVNLSGYSLDDEANIGSNPFRLPSIVMKPGDRRVFFGSETGLHLSDGGDGVRLLKPNGQLGDAYNYFVVRFPDQSYCRLPDNGGLDDWNQNCFPTPGLQNSQSASSVNPPTSGGAETLCPIADTLPEDFIFAECVPFGANIWNPAYWDRFGWFGERYLPESSGKWRVFVD